ncbi:MAG: penicillin acylase family protein [Polyangiaceae bacterium]|nr:penicillin acylase family protein [Polyangiaceae bacterium]
MLTLVFCLGLAAACSSTEGAPPFALTPLGPAGAAGSAGAAGASACEPTNFAPPSALAAVPLTTTLTSAALCAPVELVRDDAGVPHIYAASLADAAYAQGYVTANDRFVQMDFFRHNAAGTLSELFGDLVLSFDIEPRLHHLRATAQSSWQTMQASTDGLDRDSVAVLRAYAAGVNAWLGELKAGQHALPPALVSFGLRPEFISPWTEVDSLSIIELQAFALSFDITNELLRTAASERDKAVFAGASDPQLLARSGYAADVTRVSPIVPTYTLDGWGELDPGRRALPALSPPLREPEPDTALAALVGRVLPTLGFIPTFGPGARGSNGWVVSGALSQSGHPLIANDTHLSLLNPSLFYLTHLSAGTDFEVMGTQFPGLPLVMLGFNRRVAWGATVSFLDVTDVYDEAIAPCANDAGDAGDAGFCATFRGASVPLRARDEVFRVAIGGNLAQATETTMRFYDVPHHGPILPRPAGTSVEGLGARELSVRYTGHESYPIFRAVVALNRSATVAEARSATEAHFTYGRQNWMFADVDGNIGWTQGGRLPRRPATTRPWFVLPGDGSAEWDGFVDLAKMPRALNPAKGYLVTANADPIGVTDDGDPMNEPEVDGYPLYLGADFDPGGRIARITTRIEQATAGGGKLDPAAMAAIQADTFSEKGRVLRPHFVTAATALAEYVADPASHPEFDAPAAAGSVSTQPAVRAFYATARDLLTAWSLNTPAGTEPGIDQRGIDDSRAALLAAVFTTKLNLLTLADESAALRDPASGFEMPLRTVGYDRLLPLLLDQPEQLQTGEVLFDDLTTPDRLETRQTVLARAVTQTIEWALAQPALGPDPATWRWGSIHTVKPGFLIPFLFPALDQDAYPRHGGTATVDFGDPGFDDDEYDFFTGAAIRFVCELDPVKGPVARNIVPGGQIFDTASPHYKDQLELWAQNQARDLPFQLADVTASAVQEHQKNALGRLRFEPASAR